MTVNMQHDITKAIEAAGDWLQYDGVEAVGQGEHKGKPCIMVFTSVKPEALAGKIPASLYGFDVILQESGKFEAF